MPPSIPKVGGNKDAGGSDSRFFTTQKKGEMHELRLELHSTDRNTKVDAVKKVIASMTVGKDVSMLFTDVLNCVQTGNIELKKLVYLYLINYAKSQPELTLLAVNTFVKDANDPNPLIRALAVRTMGCIRVDRITEYLCEPLSRALRDEDPYVRKTAAVCVAKLYDIAREFGKQVSISYWVLPFWQVNNSSLLFLSVIPPLFLLLWETLTMGPQLR